MRSYCSKIILIIIALFVSEFTFSKTLDNDSLKVLNIIKKINQNSSRIMKVELEGNIEYESNQSGNSGSLFAVIFKPDSCYARIRGTFGITGAIMMLTRKEFTYYNAIENFVIKGPPTEKNLGIILRICISFDNLINIITGSFILPDSLTKDCKYIFTNAGLIFSKIDSTNTKKEYWIDTTNSTIFRIKSYNDSSKVDYEINFSEYKVINGIKFPFSIDFKRELKKEYLWLKYTEVNFSVYEFNYKINIPKSAKIYIWN
ncbi:MAG: DUF4292 domain-containing protein [Ignavibacteria bacterium]|nr:DUF4292 domain-containing protein [Ignavibacteria bacterium]